MNFEYPSQRSIATKIFPIEIRIRPFPSFLTASCVSYLSLSRSLSFIPCSTIHPKIACFILKSSVSALLAKSFVPFLLPILWQCLHPEGIPCATSFALSFSIYIRITWHPAVVFSSMSCPFEVSVCLPDSSCFLVTVFILVVIKFCAIYIFVKLYAVKRLKIKFC